MGSIVIHTSNDKDLSLLQALAAKMGLSSQVLDDTAKEDFAIAKAIEENNPLEKLEFNEAVEYYKSLDKAK